MILLGGIITKRAAVWVLNVSTLSHLLLLGFFIVCQGPIIYEFSIYFYAYDKRLLETYCVDKLMV